MLRSVRQDCAVSKSLTVAVAQPESVLHDVDFNVQRHAEAIYQADAQIVVFPKLSVTGYAMDAKPVSPDDERFAPIIRACGERGTVALVGAPTLGHDGDARISVLGVDGERARCVYDKVWLGGEEPDSFSPGVSGMSIIDEATSSGSAFVGVIDNVADRSCLS